MQSDRNSFCFDVVLNSVNIASRDEDRLIDQLLKANIEEAL